MTKISILTLFPEQIKQGLSYSVVGNAIGKGLIELDCRDIRDLQSISMDKLMMLFMVGTGMLMMLEPIIKTWLSLYISDPNEFIDNLPSDLNLEKWHEIRNLFQRQNLFLSPKGKIFNQNKAMKWQKMSNFVLCGHYEGIDQRIIDI